MLLELLTLTLNDLTDRQICGLSRRGRPARSRVPPPLPGGAPEGTDPPMWVHRTAAACVQGVLKPGGTPPGCWGVRGCRVFGGAGPRAGPGGAATG